MDACWEQKVVRLISVHCTWKFIHYFKVKADMLFVEWVPGMKRRRWLDVDQGQAQQWWHISMLFGFIFLLPVTTPSLPVRTHPVFLIETIIHRQGICKEKHNRKAHSSHSFFSKTPKSVLLLQLPSVHTPTCLKEIYSPCPRENQYILIFKRISRGKKVWLQFVTEQQHPLFWLHESCQPWKSNTFTGTRLAPWRQVQVQTLLQSLEHAQS